MDLVEELTESTAWTSAVMAGVGPSNFGDPTPCVEWDVRALAGHVIGGAAMFADAIAGRPQDEEREDVVGHDAGRAYEGARASLLDSCAAPDVLAREVRIPAGTVPGEVALRIIALDTLVHGWDVALATGGDGTLPTELAQRSEAFARSFVGPQFRGPGGVFAAEVEVADGASVTERLVAFLGRRPDWRP